MDMLGSVEINNPPLDNFGYNKVDSGVDASMVVRAKKTSRLRRVTGQEYSGEVRITPFWRTQH